MQIGPKYKICRRLGGRVFGKCQTTKFSTSGSGDKFSPKKRGGRRPKAASEYGQQLIEKQKARFSYLLKEGQFSNYVKKIRGHKTANPTVSLFQLLERRLDNVVYRLGLAPSRAFARQMVSHGHIMVNDRRLNIPSYQARVGDKISVRPQSQNLGLFKDYLDRQKEFKAPAWLEVNPEAKSGAVKGEPIYGASEVDIDFGAILEFYSRV